jgi:hypothetical protein
MQWHNYRMAVTALAAALTVTSPALYGKDKKPKPKDPQDTIAVVGHVAAGSSPIRRFVATTHYSRFYLYGESADGTMTLLDVTKPSQPAVLSEVSAPDGGRNIVAVAGTAALITDGDDTPASGAPHTIRIMDLSDPLHPTEVRVFNDVTAISRDDRRGLIFLANPEGIWILHQALALDPVVEKEYTRRVLYDH